MRMHPRIHPIAAAVVGLLSFTTVPASAGVITTNVDGDPLLSSTLFVGPNSLGPGTLTVDGGSVIAPTGNVFVGWEAGGQGTLNVSGAGSRVDVGGQNGGHGVFIGGTSVPGAGGFGTVNVTNGGQLTAVGSTDANGNFVNARIFIVDGTGSLNIASGGDVLVHNPAGFGVEAGVNTGRSTTSGLPSSASISVDGIGSTLTVIGDRSFINVGSIPLSTPAHPSIAQSTAIVTNGAHVGVLGLAEYGIVNVGRGENIFGSLTVDDASFEVVGQTAASFHVGQGVLSADGTEGGGGTGFVDLRNGARLSLVSGTASAALVIGNNGNGAVSVTDSAIELASSDSGAAAISIGQLGGTGRLSLDNGTVSMLNTVGSIGVGNTGGSQPGTLGILELNNGSSVDATNLFVGFSALAPTTGLVTVRNGSTLNLEGQIAIGGGGTMIINDTSVATAGASVTVNGGFMGGTGSVVAPIVNIINGGIWSIGNSPGSMSVFGDMVFGDGGILSIEAAGLGAGQFDVLNVFGDVTFLAGSAIRFDFLDGFIPGADFGLDFLFANNILGLGDAQFLFSGLPQGYDFDVSAGSNGLRLTRVAVPEPSMLALLAGGLIGLVAASRRRRRA